MSKLIIGKKSTGGRNHTGRITAAHRGAGVKRNYRLITFKKQNLQGLVKQIEYDPNRTAPIMLLEQETGSNAYILGIKNLQTGVWLKNTAYSANTNPLGSTLQLKDIPIGVAIHNIERYPNCGGIFVRAAGEAGQILGYTERKNKKYAIVLLPSKQKILLNPTCYATIGTIADKIVSRKKTRAVAGQQRRLGRRPGVRGLAMNACDHPHGGSTKGTHPKTPKGKYTKGPKTNSKITRRTKIFSFK